MRTGLCFGLLAALALGQADFESQSPPCFYAFPTRCGMAGDPEGVSRSAAAGLGGSVATVDIANQAGMPCTGQQYARIIANGAPLTIPPGGPFPGGAAIGSQLYIPIPSGASSVSFCWDFYLVGPATAASNDGMAIDLIGGCAGAALANLVYADAFSPTVGPADVGSNCASGGAEVIPTGIPQSVASAPIPPGATHLRVAVWSGGDNLTPSHGVIDNVTFAGAGVPPCTLSFTSPAGPGSIMMDNTACAASVGLTYFSVVDLTAGTFPAGWFFGLDVGMGELLNLFNVGPPFTGVLNGAGASTTGVIGPVPALSGLTLYGVTTEWTPGFATLVQTRPAVSYTIP